MADKVIILKNVVNNSINIRSLGLLIKSGDDTHYAYSDILDLDASQELKDLIIGGSIVLNDGINDLAPATAIEYLRIGYSVEQNVYTKEQTDSIINNIVVNNLNPIQESLSADYYTRLEVDSMITAAQANGIKGAVDFYDDLPTIGNAIGDIYIVRSSIGQGLGPVPFITDGQTGLYLPFDTTWQDQLGHPGQSYSSVNPVPGGVFGNAAHFDGVDDWIRFYSSSDFGEGPTLTVGGRIYVERNGNYGIIGRWNNDDGWKLDVHGNKLRASLDTTSHSEAIISSPSNIPTDTWLHVAMVYDGNNLILYINAQPVNSTQIDGNTIDSYDLDVYVGKYMDEYGEDDDSSDKYFKGFMCDMFIENRSMSQEELEGLVYGGVSNYKDEGFYKWSGTEWEFLSRNTGDGGGGGLTSHNSLLGLNSGEYQHLTSDEKMQLTDGETTTLHNHNDTYYTKTESNNNFAPLSHSHDDRYYSKTQVDNLINTIDFTKISSNDSSTNITGAELEQLTNGSNADGLHTHASSGGSGSGGLDDAYDGHSQWSQGTGREVSVDFGAVSLNASNGHAPLRLAEIDYVPSQWLNTGHMCVYDSELFIYDATRSCWNSVSGYYIGGGYNSNNISNTYLKGYNGTSFNDDVGWVAPWDGVITAMSASSSSNTWQAIEVRRNGNSTTAKVWYNNNKKTWSKDIDVKFNEGDVLNFYATENADGCDKPQVWAVIKRRIS